MTPPEPHERRVAADAWRTNVTEPLRNARDHAHYRSVVRRDRVAGYVETLLEALLRLSYDQEGRLARGEAGEP